MRTSSIVTLLTGLSLVLAAGGCRGEGYDFGGGQIDFDPDRPNYDDPEAVEPYDGDNEIVLEAQSEFPTGIEFHQKVIWRTCTPNEGVCHNSKEYPDLRTPANFAASFGAPCNLQPGEYQSVYDGCEQPGDKIRLGGAWDTIDLELGWIDYIPGPPPEGGYGDDSSPVYSDSAGLHIHLKTPITSDNQSTYTTAEFSRSFIIDGEVNETVFTSYSTRWWIVDDGPGDYGTHIMGEVRPYQVDQVESLATMGTLVLGDGNHNGIFGAEFYEPAAMLEPGSPETSYLIARLRGEMHDEVIPGSRMPLANQPFTIPEMLALYCLVEGYPADGDASGLTGAIDYKNCSYSVDPENLNLLGDGVTWESRISKIIEFNCGGCHSDPDPQGNLNLVGDGVYERLLEMSEQMPDMPLIHKPSNPMDPGDPMNSYLFLKLIGDDSIIGQKMPYNPLTGEGSLTQSEIDEIETWIINGAIENE